MAGVHRAEYWKGRAGRGERPGEVQRLPLQCWGSDGESVPARTLNPSEFTWGRKVALPPARLETWNTR